MVEISRFLPPSHSYMELQAVKQQFSDAGFEVAKIFNGSPQRIPGSTDRFQPIAIVLQDQASMGNAFAWLNTTKTPLPGVVLIGFNDEGGRPSRYAVRWTPPQADA